MPLSQRGRSRDIRDIATRLGRAEGESYIRECRDNHARLRRARTAEGDEMWRERVAGDGAAAVGMMTRHYGNVCRPVRAYAYTRALISFPQPAHFFFRPSGDGIRALARACERGGSRIIKDGLTIFPRVPGGRGQCDGALRGICRCTRCCVCFY